MNFRFFVNTLRSIDGLECRIDQWTSFILLDQRIFDIKSMRWYFAQHSFIEQWIYSLFKQKCSHSLTLLKIVMFTNPLNSAFDSISAFFFLESFHPFWFAPITTRSTVWKEVSNWNLIRYQKHIFTIYWILPLDFVESLDWPRSSTPSQYSQTFHNSIT